MDPFAFLDAYGITDTGQKRTENQDSILVRTGDGVFVVRTAIAELEMRQKPNRYAAAR